MPRIVRTIARYVTFFYLAVSTFLLIIIATMWVRSYSPLPWTLSVEAPPRLYELRSANGAVTIALTRGWPGMDMLGFTHGPNAVIAPTIHRFCGVSVWEAPTMLMQMYSPTAQDLGMMTGNTSWVSQAKPNALTTMTIGVPYRVPAILTGWPIFVAAIVLIWRAVRARQRFGPGCCTKCGYDLRATPGRCPECGTVSAA